MNRFRGISAFVAVARAGGFSAAARELGIPLPTVSRRVADLEHELGVRLFHRSTRRVELTVQGQTFYASCRRLLDDLRDAEASITGEYRTPKGELTVTAPVGFGRMHLQPIALEFLRAYPEINLRLLLVDRVVNLLEEHVDAALRIAELPDSSLIARPLGHIRMVVCASPDYCREHGMPQHPSELVAHECIAWSALGAANAWRFREQGEERAFPIRVRLTTTIAESATDAAAAGLGLAQITSNQAEHGIRAGTLQLVLRDYECAPTPVSLVHASQRMVPLKLRALFDYTVPRLAERLSAIAAVLD
jgi:DNA-binding transcriptional LysR family regulator